MTRQSGSASTTADMVSIVIPVKNEAQNVSLLAAKIDDFVAALTLPWECLWVDDGSSDGTHEELASLADRSARHTYVRLDRSYGQSAALAVGFDNARGRIIVTLDGDGQNPPQEIPRLVELLIHDNLDMVCGYRTKRYGFVRSLSSRIANSFRNAVTGDRIRDVGCSLRAFRSECVAGLFVFRGMHRFLPTLVRLNGYGRIVEVPVEHFPRQLGRSKYGVNNRLWVGIADTLAVRWMSKRKVTPKVRAGFPVVVPDCETVGAAENTTARVKETTA